MEEIKKVLILTNDSELEKLPGQIEKVSQWYYIEFTVCHVVDLGIIQTDRVVYLPEVCGNGTTRNLGDRVPLSETLIKRQQDEYIERGQKVVDTFTEKLNRLGVSSKSVVLIGNPVREVTKYVKDNQIELIITGQSPRNRLSKVFTKPLINKLMQNPPCSIWVQ